MSWHDIVLFFCGCFHDDRSMVTVYLCVVAIRVGRVYSRDDPGTP